MKKIMVLIQEWNWNKNRPRLRWMDDIEKEFRNLDVVTAKLRHKNDKVGEIVRARVNPRIVFSNININKHTI
jgi:hypothetical protein